MTVVNPKSISGINSITTGSGSDNLLTIHTSDASSTERVRINSSGDVIVGSGITVSPDGDIFTTGVTTATTFVGALTGNVTGNISGGTVAGSTGTFTGDVDIADKIVHTGDTNTALRFPSADTITAETGGTERFRITSAGKFLIGSTAARSESNGFAAPLQVEGTNTATSSVIIARNSANASSSQLIFQKSRGTSVGSNTVIQGGDVVGSIIFEGSDGTNTDSLASIIGVCDATPGNNDVPGRLVFSTTADGAAIPTERLRITSGGLVGIGQATPTHMLHVDSSSASDSTATAFFKGRIVRFDGAAASNSPRLNFSLDGTDKTSILLNRTDNSLNIETLTSAPIIFDTNSTERLRIASNGYITEAFKPVKTAQDTNLQHTTGDRFQIDLPSTSRMYRITGSFSWNSGIYRIWGDLGGWTDGHTPQIEGFANWWYDGAGGPTYQDVTSTQYFEVADPVDSGFEVTYDILLTTMAHNGTARPGVSGNISWTYNGVGRAWTVFSYQDTAASGTDRKQWWAWDIDIVSGTLGTGQHQYVIEQYPITQ